MKIVILILLALWIFGDTVKDFIKGFADEVNIPKAMVKKIIIALIIVLIMFF